MTETYFNLLFVLIALWFAYWGGFQRGKTRAIEVYEAEKKKEVEVR